MTDIESCCGYVVQRVYLLKAWNGKTIEKRAPRQLQIPTDRITVSCRDPHCFGVR